VAWEQHGCNGSRPGRLGEDTAMGRWRDPTRTDFCERTKHDFTTCWVTTTPQRKGWMRSDGLMETIIRTRPFGDVTAARVDGPS
jgi:hypothetical protein